MKLIIDIPKGTYEAVKVGTINQVLEYKVWNAIKNGIPLDDIKAELERANRMYPYTNHGILEAIAIINKHIGKGDSE